MFRRSGDSAVDVVARGLASGMSRREALRAGGAALVGAVALSPGDAWAALTGTCPTGRVHCHGKCCPRGEVCRQIGGKHHCACPHHGTRCSGQCVSIRTDEHNCGRCGHGCATGQHCSTGRCLCPTGDALCARVCVPLAHDPRNCGTCGHACPSGQVCSSGHCVTFCATGQTNCSGACVNLKSNVHHCGSCGHACPSGYSCVNGTCTLVCPEGQTACAGNCVDISTDPNNCGACGHVCGTDHACSGGTCVVSCPSGETNCSGSCVDTSTNAANCGGCGQACTPNNASSATCSNSTCSYTCDAHFGDCVTTPPNTGGCETSLTTTTNCGSCGNPCNPTHATGTCASGICAIESCDAGFHDCNNNPADGCETDITTVQNCGGCGAVCNQTNAASASCDGTTCSYTCKSGFVNCNTTAPNTGGCECAGTGCCMGGCQTQHSNGVGQNFYDCNALGTHNVTQATEACNADSGASGTCTDGWTSGSTGNVLTSVCRTAGNGTTGSCVCWGYQGSGTASAAVGHVSTSSNGCFGATSTDPTWN